MNLPFGGYLTLPYDRNFRFDCRLIALDTMPPFILLQDAGWLAGVVHSNPIYEQMAQLTFLRSVGPFFFFLTSIHIFFQRIHNQIIQPLRRNRLCPTGLVVIFGIFVSPPVVMRGVTHEDHQGNIAQPFVPVGLCQAVSNGSHGERRVNRPSS